MFKIILSVFITLILIFNSRSQNLVNNASFEELQQCPYASSTFNPHELAYAIGWDYPTDGTSDLFNSCASPGPVGVPSNFIGYQNPFDGNSYAGFGFYSDVSWEDIIVAEYIQTELTRSLELNEKILVRFYLSLAEASKYGTSKISVYFSEDISEFNALSNAPVTVFSPVYSTNSKMFSEKDNWMLFECEYVSTGCEKFMTIGCFENSLDLDTIPSSPPTGDPNLFYYFMDSVSVTSLTKDFNFELPNVITANKDKINDLWYPNSICNKNWTCNIFNRWGNLVFSLTPKNGGWDGTDINGIELPDGVYFYSLKIDELNEDHSGFIHLVR